MKAKYLQIFTCLVVGFVCSSSTAAEIVNFDADSIQSNVFIPRNLQFDASKPILSSKTHVKYTGPTVYGAFKKEGTSLIAGSKKQDAGLKIRWNGGEGTPGESSSGLFLFKSADFLNGLNAIPLSFVEGRDKVSVEFAYVNPGKLGEDFPVKEAWFRFVIKDSRGYHVSAPAAIDSKLTLDFIATPQIYYHYDPFVNSENSAGTIGEESKPSFKAIEFVGFHLEAKRGNDIKGGANIGVIKFIVNANAQ